MTRHTSGCLIMLVALCAIGPIAAAGLLGCGGAAVQATSHTTIATVCLAEEQRAVDEEQYQEDARARVDRLRHDCDALLHDVAAGAAHDDAGPRPDGGTP